MRSNGLKVGNIAWNGVMDGEELVILQVDSHMRQRLSILTYLIDAHRDHSTRRNKYILRCTANSAYSHTRDCGLSSLT